MPEQQLARKIVAATGSGPVSLVFENRSTLGRREAEIIQNGTRSSLQAMGVRFADQATASVRISLSENLTSYVWVAEVRKAGSELAVAMVSTPRPAGTVPHDSVPFSLRKTLLWSQSDPILDLVVLEEAAAPVRIAVLGAEKLSLYRMRDGRWQAEQVLDIVHNKPWPHDLRGRLFPGSNHLPDVYLPGVICHTTAVSPIALNCHDGEDPWPLMPSISVPGTYAFFAPARNFFTGDLTVGGKVTSVPKFYSAALLQRDRDLLWFFSAVDRQVHIVDSGGDRMTKLNWGSDLTSVKTACGAGWQILATASEDGTADSVRAYEVPDRDPVAVSAVLDFPGAISALWTESKADTAIAVARNPETGNYEAFRVAVACNQ